MRKGQTAMEYLMTYGWAILIIMVVLAVLFYLGVLNPQVPSQCTFPAGLSCVSYKITQGAGNLTLDLGQGTGHPILVTGVYCSANTTGEYSPTSVFYDGGPGVNMTIPTSSHALVAQLGTKPTVQCKDAQGNAMDANTASVGSRYIGRIYINYTELDTGVQKMATGSITAGFEV